MGTIGERSDKPLDINALSRAVRALYITHRRMRERALRGASSRWGDTYMPRWDGGVDVNGRKFKSCWVQIVKLCNDNGVSPLTHVAANFSLRGDVPHPNMLLGSKAVEATRTYLESLPSLKPELDTALRSFRLHVGRLKSEYGLDTTEAARRVLRDPAIGFDPVAKYVLAKSGNDTDLAKMFLDVAALRYAARAAAYEQYWSDWITDELRQRAADLSGGLTDTATHEAEKDES